MEKEKCQSCGADVREDTLFCYNCGKSVAAEPTSSDEREIETNGSNSDAIAGADSDADKELARLFRIDELPPEDKLASAAAERRKARSSQRRRREIVWESGDESSNRLYVLITLLITVIAAAIVFLAVYWK